LTEEEEKEKESLLSTGFYKWKKREYNLFIELIKKYGKQNYAKIAEEIGNGFTASDVEKYSNVFWGNIDKIENGDKIAKLMEKKEKADENLKMISKLLDERVGSKYDMVLQVKYDRECMYTPIVDSALLYYCHVHGYGKWHLIKAEMINDDKFIFNSYIKSRNIDDIKGRIDILLKQITKEKEGNPDKEDDTKPKKRKAESEMPSKKKKLE